MSARILGRALAAAAGLAVLAASGSAAAISRSEVMARAKAFAFHPWTCGSANLTASCNGAYTSVYVPGDYVGLPYDWGGYMSLFTFDQGIASGLGAGSYPDDGVLSCTVGLDCSGFVSEAWATSHYTTSSLPTVSTAIDTASLLPGDVLNDAGYHVALFSHLLGNGEPVFIEAIGYNVHVNATEGWSHVDGYVPRRFTGITGTTAPDLLGTPTNPIVIPSFPYTDARDTTQSPSDLLDGCGAAPGKAETGPEYVYQATFTKPGKLTATIADDVGVDIDIHLYTSMNTSDCVARNDTTITVDVDCGTYYLVADTFKGTVEYPGPYTLTADFVPSGAPCGSGPPAYAPSGAPGDGCGYPGNPDLPFCNPNLGADTCLYTDTTSFCSLPCAADADCGAFAGGCCGDIGGGEKYCFTAALCGSSNPPDPQGQPDAGGDPDLDGGATGNGGSGSGNGGSGSGNGGSGSGDGGGPPGGNSSSGGGQANTHHGCSAGGTAPGGLGVVPAMIALLAIARRRRRAQLL